MRAEIVFHIKGALANGDIYEIKIWRLPRPTSERLHGLKYSLFYGQRGQRIVGYDNERGKGDHRHIGAREYAYAFSTVDQLIADFWADVGKETLND